jgi:peroxiredoxin
LGRHRVVLVFFDAAVGADRDPVLDRLRQNYDVLQADGTIVLGVSAALPQDNRKVFARSGEFPFPLLSDPTLEAHRQWGLLDEATGKPRPGVFIIDRKGEVAWSVDAPQPLRDPQTTIDEILSGE